MVPYVEPIINEAVDPDLLRRTLESSGYTDTPERSLPVDWSLPESVPLLGAVGWLDPCWTRLPPDIR
jgi:hypothetical protein